MDYPKISLVTPNFNQVAYLEETIQSVLSQNYPNLEYIIIDGGSTDGSVNVIKKYEDQLAYWVSEPDKGMYDALNKGFSRSSGEIMSWINSDDLLAPNSLFVVAGIMSKFTYIKWLSGMPNQMHNASIVNINNLPKWNIYKYLASNYKYIQQEGTFWKRSVWELSGKHLSTEYQLASDLELWSRFFRFADIYFVPTILGTFRYRGNGQKSMSSPDIYIKESEAIIKKMPQNRFEKLYYLSFITSGIKRKAIKMMLAIFFGKQKKKVELFPNPIYFDYHILQFVHE